MRPQIRRSRFRMEGNFTNCTINMPGMWRNSIRGSRKLVEKDIQTIELAVTTNPTTLQTNLVDYWKFNEGNDILDQ